MGDPALDPEPYLGPQLSPAATGQAIEGVEGEVLGIVGLGDVQELGPSAVDLETAAFAEAAGELEPGGRIVEGTAGNTGIGVGVDPVDPRRVFASTAWMVPSSDGASAERRMRPPSVSIQSVNLVEMSMSREAI